MSNIFPGPYVTFRVVTTLFFVPVRTLLNCNTFILSSYLSGFLDSVVAFHVLHVIFIGRDVVFL